MEPSRISLRVPCAHQTIWYTSVAANRYMSSKMSMDMSSLTKGTWLMEIIDICHGVGMLKQLVKGGRGLPSLQIPSIPALPFQFSTGGNWQLTCGHQHWAPRAEALLTDFTLRWTLLFRNSRWYAFRFAFQSLRSSGLCSSPHYGNNMGIRSWSRSSETQW